jgi:hypothetical protein
MLLGYLLSFMIVSSRGAEPADSWRALLPEVRAYESDLGVRPERWDAPLANPVIEGLLNRPLNGPAVFQSWDNSLAAESSSHELLSLAWSMGLSKPAETEKPVSSTHFKCSGLNESLEVPLAKLVDAMAAAQSEIPRLEPAARLKIEEGLSAVLINKPFPKLNPELFEAASHFDVERVIASAERMASSVDEILPFLKKAPAPAKKITCPSALGNIIIGSGADDSYSPEDLAGAALILDLGGQNRYLGPAAAAGPGELKIAIDRGSNSVFESSGAAAGSGQFGIGLLYALGPGTTTISAGDFSAGSGFFGVGAAFISGTAKIDTLSFGQGAGAFGLGLLALSGPAELSARFASEGFGFTRGIGILTASKTVSARCGLYFPDGHENLAWISLCQGVGQGPRAYAAGGIGLARLGGENSSLESGYFAQGAGYWHGLGALFVHGKASRLQARRYVQGTGVHTAVGALGLYADEIKTAAWGVGPGFAWDRGIGYLDSVGDRQHLRSDWAAAGEQIGGRAFVRISGESDELYLGEAGRADFDERGGPGYTLMAITGPRHRLRVGFPVDFNLSGRLALSPSGIISSSEPLVFDMNLKSEPIPWPSPDRKPFAEREAAELKDRMDSATLLPQEKQSAELLSLISGLSLDFSSAEALFKRLSELPAAEIISLLSPERFDELLWLRPLAAAIGEQAAQAALAELPKSSGIKRALLIGTIAQSRIEIGLRPILAELSSQDWKTRKAAAAAIGSLFDSSRAQEPGRLAFLADSLKILDGGSETDFIEDVRHKRLADLYAALALAGPLSQEDKISLIQKARSPFDPVPQEALRLYADLIRKDGKRFKKAFSDELYAANSRLPLARGALEDAARDPDPETAAAALLSLGKLGDKKDASILETALGAQTAVERAGAAAGLARLGPKAAAAIDQALGSDNPRTRSEAASAAAQSTDAKVMISALHKAFLDPHPSVRRTALSALSEVVDALRPKRRELVVDLRRLADEDPHPELKALAAIRLKEIAPELK